MFCARVAISARGMATRQSVEEVILSDNRLSSIHRPVVPGKGAQLALCKTGLEATGRRLGVGLPREALNSDALHCHHRGGAGIQNSETHRQKKILFFFFWGGAVIFLR